MLISQMTLKQRGSLLDETPGTGGAGRDPAQACPARECRISRISAVKPCVRRKSGFAAAATPRAESLTMMPPAAFARSAGVGRIGVREWIHEKLQEVYGVHA